MVIKIFLDNLIDTFVFAAISYNNQFAGLTQVFFKPKFPNITMLLWLNYNNILFFSILCLAYL